jgi:ankyrin repeat protein
VEVVSSLLDAGATLNAVNNDGQTPLYLCMMHNQPHIAQLLVDRGANCIFKDVNVPTWLHAITEKRSRCRSAVAVLIGIHKYHRTKITGKNDINMLRLIGKHIWSTRMDDVWDKDESQVAKKAKKENAILKSDIFALMNEDVF